MDSPSSLRTIRVVAAVIEREGRYLITQRRPTAVLPLLWEFPGGRVEDGETDAAAALKREVRHRLGVEIEVGQLISFVSHPYERYVVDLYLYECRMVGHEGGPAKGPPATSSGRRQRLQVGDQHAEFDQYPFTRRRRGEHEQAARRGLSQLTAAALRRPHRAPGDGALQPATARAYNAPESTPGDPPATAGPPVRPAARLSFRTPSTRHSSRLQLRPGSARAAARRELHPEDCSLQRPGASCTRKIAARTRTRAAAHAGGCRVCSGPAR